MFRSLCSCCYWKYKNKFGSPLPPFHLSLSTLQSRFRHPAFKLHGAGDEFDLPGIAFEDFGHQSHLAVDKCVGVAEVELVVPGIAAARAFSVHIGAGEITQFGTAEIIEYTDALMVIVKIFKFGRA